MGKARSVKQNSSKSRRKVGKPADGKHPGGRPPTIKAYEFVGLRLPSDLLNQIFAWAERENIIGKSEAIRALIERGLKGGS